MNPIFKALLISRFHVPFLS